ncbi:hypothetical protein [Tenacibaculum holothuriorum]|nr:hypothetical protein [Tenacibaculum holothuriorum]
MHQGEATLIICDNCMVKTKVDNKNFFAKESKIRLLIAFLILLAGTPLVYFLIKDYISNSSIKIIGLIAIPSFIYSIFRKEELNRVRTFNNG